MSKALFEKIYNLSKAQHVSIPTLEKELGFGNRSLYKWDSISPSVDKVIKVADFFGVSLDELCGRSMPGDKTKYPVFGSIPPLMVREDAGQFGAPKISDDEKKLLDLFADLNDEGREHALAVLEGLAASGIYKKYDLNKMVEG